MPMTLRYPVLMTPSISIQAKRVANSDIEALFRRKDSPEATHFRFVGAAAAVTTEAVKRLTSSDGRSSIVFEATLHDVSGDTEVGVGSFARCENEDARLMTVTVVDKSKNAFLLTSITRQLIEFARGYGITRLYAMNSVEDQCMRQLADDLGMASKTDDIDEHQVLYSLAL